MTNEIADESCMAKWGRCMYRAHLKLYKSVSVTCYNKFNILYNYRSYLMKGMIRHFVVGLIIVHELLLTLADNYMYRLKLFAYLVHLYFSIIACLPHHNL